jgi:lipopolysaccharide/colanic/teichoic acid biosynthesis glycosyltransferase
VDELPQLVNVLRGEMSLVGPRPTVASQVERYSDEQRRRLEVKPGLTGWAQINGRNTLSWPERIGLDVWYVDNKSLWLDIKIIARTPKTLLNPVSVYGPSGVNNGL